MRGSSAGSTPHTRIAPSLGSSCPCIIRSAVVLPAPFGPSSPKLSRGATWDRWDGAGRGGGGVEGAVGMEGPLAGFAGSQQLVQREREVLQAQLPVACPNRAECHTIGSDMHEDKNDSSMPRPAPTRRWVDSFDRRPPPRPAAGSEA
eukprot:356269-Chlamydomonas_euryale.AAC.4